MTTSKIVGGNILTIAFLAVIVFTMIWILPIESPDSPDEVEIPVLMDVSGPNAEFGTDIVKGISLAVDVLNEKKKGGVTYSITVYDTGGDIDTAVSQFKLIESLGFPVLIGPLTSEEATAINGLHSDVICITPSATSADITDYPNFYRVVCTDRYLANGITKMINNSGMSKIALLYNGGSSYSVGHMLDFIAASLVYPHFDITVIDADERDSAVEELLAVHPDVVFAPMASSDAFIDVYGEAAAGLDCSIITTDNMMTDAVPLMFDGISMITSVRNVTDATYIDHYVKTYGELEYTEAIYGYDATMLLAEVIFSEGYSTDMIKKGLDRIRYVGVSGMIKFDEHGDATSSFELFVSYDGEWVMLGWKEIMSF